jgi:hypothetical protein
MKLNKLQQKGFVKMAIETELETVKRHLGDYKNFEFEERMLRKKYEKALEEITRQYDNTSVNRAKEIANEALGELKEARRREIQSY